MKINKSNVSIALMLVFMMSACSQARYGNMTRRVKTDRVAKNIEKPVKVEKEISNEVMAVEVVKTDIVPNLSIGESLVKEETAVKNVVSEKSARLMDETGEKSEVKANTAKQIVSTKLNKLAKKPMINQATKTLEKLKVQKTDSDSGLIRLILIILLVLLILSLLTKLVPGLSWVLGVLLLIVLIWFVLQLL
jgi:hypothetical protein